MKFNSIEELGSEPIGKLLIKYATPCIIGNILSILYNLIDRIFIGQACDVNAIAGLAITTPIITFYSIIGRFLSNGASTQISIALGQKDHKTVDKILGNAYIMLFVIQIITLIPLVLFLKPLLIKSGCNMNTINSAKEYIYWLLPCMVIDNFCIANEEILRSTGFPKKATFALLIGIAINAILDPIFIFKFDMGIKGTALATDIAIGISFFYLLLHFFNKKNNIHFKQSAFRLDFSIIQKMCSIGSSSLIISVASSLVALVINTTLKIYGSDNDIAAAGIINSLSYTVNMFTYGLCQGMKPLVSYNYGANFFERMKGVFWLTVKNSIFFGVIIYIILAVFSKGIGSFFAKDFEIIKITSTSLRIALAISPFMGLYMATINYLQAIEMPKIASFLSICRQIIFLIPLVYILPKFFGKIGVWIAVPVTDVFALIITMILVYSKKAIFFTSK